MGGSEYVEPVAAGVEEAFHVHKGSDLPERAAADHPGDEVLRELLEDGTYLRGGGGGGAREARIWESFLSFLPRSMKKSNLTSSWRERRRSTEAARPGGSLCLTAVPGSSKHRTLKIPQTVLKCSSRRHHLVLAVFILAQDLNATTHIIEYINRPFKSSNFPSRIRLTRKGMVRTLQPVGLVAEQHTEKKGHSTGFSESQHGNSSTALEIKDEQAHRCSSMGVRIPKACVGKQASKSRCSYLRKTAPGRSKFLNILARGRVQINSILRAHFGASPAALSACLYHRLTSLTLSLRSALDGSLTMGVSVPS